MSGLYMHCEGCLPELLGDGICKKKKKKRLENSSCLVKYHNVPLVGFYGIATNFVISITPYIINTNFTLQCML